MELNFNTLHPQDLSWLTQDEVIQAITNTFPSRVLDSSVEWTIIESDWQILDKEDELNIIKYGKNIINHTFKIYFHIYTDDFIILRGDSQEHIANYMANAKAKNADIIDTKTDYTNGARWFSTILEGRRFPRILTSTAPIKKGTDATVTVHIGYDHRGTRVDIGPYKGKVCEAEIAFYLMVELIKTLHKNENTNKGQLA